MFVYIMILILYIYVEFFILHLLRKARDCCMHVFSSTIVLIKYSLRSLCYRDTARHGGWCTTQIAIAERGLRRRLGRRFSHKHSKFSLSRSTRHIQGMSFLM